MIENFSTFSNSLIQPVYSKVKEMILSGKLKPGEKIRQEKLASQLKISRTPLVKALHLLEQELLVVNIPRRGMYVKIISDKELIDAFECRFSIEITAIRLATERMTENEIADMSSIFTPFSGKKNIDTELYKTADILFHQKLIDYSRNKYLERMMAMTNILSTTYQRGLIRPPLETLPEHIEIISAIKERNIKVAELTLKNHIQKSIVNIIQHMKSDITKVS